MDKEIKKSREGNFPQTGLSENRETEFKEMYTPKINKEIVAFLNTAGGILYLGVDDGGRAVGLDDVDAVVRQVSTGFRDSISPDPTASVSVEPALLSGKPVVKVAVARGAAPPYCLAAQGPVPQGVYVRVGSVSVQATREHIRQMLRESGGAHFVEEPSAIQNLTFDFAGRVFTEKGLPFSANNKRTLGLLGQDGRFTNLGLLLSDQCPWTVKAAIFEGTTRAVFKDRKEFSGSVFRQLEELLEYLTVFNKISSTFEGMYRVDHPDYPAVAIREAAVNALIHRDYTIAGSILVSLYDNRLDFMSLGGLMPGVTRELLLHGVSVPRNEKLANVFFRLNLIEAYGTGIPRIFEIYAEKGAAPAIPVTTDGFLISLPNLNYVPSAQSFAVAEKSPPPYLSRVFGAAGVPGTRAAFGTAGLSGTAQRLNKKEMRLLEAMRGAIFSKEDAAEALGLSASGAYKLLARMADKGLLASAKKGKALFYRVNG